MSPDDLARVRWKGEATYRVLSYYFTLRWNRASIGEYVHHVLERFAIPPDPGEQRNPPTPGMPPAYSLVDLGPRAERRYKLLYPDAILVAGDHPSDVLHHLFWHINSEAIRRTGDFLLIHSGAVVTPAGDGVLVPGESGSGKTTLVTGLVQAGFGYLSDEAGAIDPVSGMLYPYARALTLKKDPAELFRGFSASNGHSGLMRGTWHVQAEDIRPGAMAGPSDVRFVVASRYERWAPTELVPMGRAEAVPLLWANALNLSLYGSRALPLLARVVRGARCFWLVSGHLEDAVRAIAKITRRR